MRRWWHSAIAAPRARPTPAPVPWHRAAWFEVLQFVFLGAAAVSGGLRRNSRGDVDAAPCEVLLRRPVRLDLEDGDLTSAELEPGTVPARCGVAGFLLIGAPPEGIDEYVLPGNNYHVFDYSLFWANVRAGVINWNKPTNGAPSNAPFGGVFVNITRPLMRVLSQRYAPAA